MRTTLEIDPRLLHEAMEVTGATTKTAAVRLGLEALLDRAARRRLVALHGQLPDFEAAPRRRPEPAVTPR